MAIPTEKAPEIDNLLTRLTGVSRRKAIHSNVCTGCGRPAHLFRDALSQKEFTISGLCQDCQDKVFVEDEDDKNALLED